MAKAQLTAGRVASFECPEGKAQAFLWDDVQKGLGLRVTSAGSKAYIFESLYLGRSVRITIGAPRDWTIPEAQKRVRELQRLIDQGIDPRTQKAEREAASAARQAQARKATVTVATAWAEYVQARTPKWKPRTLLDHQRLASAGGTKRMRGKGTTVAGPLAPLMSLKLTDVNAGRLAAWLETESAIRPSNAAHAFRLVRGFINWAVDHEQYKALIKADAYRNQAVAEAVPQQKAKEGDCLQREQLKPWFAAVRQLGNPVASAYLQAVLLTGARREEMAALRWQDVDFQWGSLSIDDKVEGRRQVPLTPYVSQLLAALPRRDAWVFSSPTSKDGRIKEPRVPHERALQAAGLPHITIHGLRRSFGTLCEWVEMPAGISAQIMGHKPSALAEKHYRRRPLDLLRQWHSKAEAWMLEQAGIVIQTEQSKGRSVRVVAGA